MSYRVELSVSARAGCQGTYCKKEGIKIGKGELRQGVAVQFKDQTTMKWRHWGCVTPTVIHNWNETHGGDMDLVDGYDELPPDAKLKVSRTFEQGHVDDDDWNGDEGMNRYDPNDTRRGMYNKETKSAARKKVKEEAEDDDHEDVPKKPTKKRARKAADDGEDEEAEEKKTVAKKARAKKTDDAPAAKKGKGRKKAQPVSEESDAVEDAEVSDEPKPAPKKSRAKKGAAKTAEADGDGAANEPAAKPVKAAKRKGKAKKAADE